MSGPGSCWSGMSGMGWRFFIGGMGWSGMKVNFYLPFLESLGPATASGYSATKDDSHMLI